MAKRISSLRSWEFVRIMYEKGMISSFWGLKFKLLKLLNHFKISRSIESVKGHSEKVWRIESVFL